MHMCQLLLHTATSQFACTVSNYGITPHDAKVSRQCGGCEKCPYGLPQAQVTHCIDGIWQTQDTTWASVKQVAAGIHLHLCGFHEI